MKEWRDVGLGEVCELKYGKSLVAKERDGGAFPVFGSNGIVGWHSKAITEGPAIIVGRKGSYGEVAYSGSPCWPIDTTYFVDQRATSADLQWLAYRLEALGLSELNRAAAIPGLNRDDAYRQRLLLPPLDEQRRIAAILDQTDALRAKRRHTLTLLDDLVSELFDATFSRRDDPISRLDALVDPDDRMNYGVVQPGDAVADGVPLIRVSNLVAGLVDRNDLKQIKPDIEATYARSRIRGSEILVSCVGSIGTIGVTSEQDVGSNVARAITRVPISDPITRAYVASYLRTPRPQRYFTAELRTVAQATLNVKQLAATPVPVPPANVQRQFVGRLDYINAQRDAAQRSLDLLDELFASLQARAFSGQL